MLREKYEYIEDYPNYMVSDRGRVLNIKTGRVMAMFRNTSNGWYFVTLSRKGKQSTIPVHRLVAEAFMEIPEDPNTSILHRDGDRSHNHISNLVWKPRWFVVTYMKEMQYEHYFQPEEIWSDRYGPTFESVAHAAHELLMLPSVLYGKVYSQDPTHFPGYGRLAVREIYLSNTRAEHGL